MNGLCFDVEGIAEGIPSTTEYWQREPTSARSWGKFGLQTTPHRAQFETSGDINSYLTDKNDEKKLNSLMGEFNDKYNIKRAEEVRVFLEDNDYLTPLISEAYGKLRKHFPNSPISMQLDQDGLVIIVGTSLSPEDTDRKLHDFDEEWWIDASVNSRARLCITVEFQ